MEEDLPREKSTTSFKNKPMIVITVKKVNLVNEKVTQMQMYFKTKQKDLLLQLMLDWILGMARKILFKSTPQQVIAK